MSNISRTLHACQAHTLPEPGRLPPLYLLAFLLLLMLAGCKPESVATFAMELPPATVEPTAVVRSLPPPVVATVAVPPSQLSFSAPTVGEESEAESDEWVATVAPPMIATEPLVAAAVPVAESSPTPQPTFTPPLMRQASSSEHFWFHRPVAEGGIVWTDKIYPYGGTRGGTLRTHHGVEFNVGYQTQILAVAGGTVRVAGDDSLVAYGATTHFYGNLVVIEHDFQYDGRALYTLYGHLQQILVVPGQQVRTHEVIGLSGASGVADGPHLHFEVRVGENSYDATRNPLLWLYPFPDRGVVAGRVTWPDSSLVYEAPVSLRRLDAPSAYAATTTYADNNVNADDKWGENFALDDVVAGYYELTVHAGDKKYTAELWVYPYQTSFVEIVIE